ncbi:hypothetical protein H6F40_20265 [Microcystis wesenbergii FACHB-1339]|nr:hypothetical protein [Microcystis wesenbergii FACHB-1339]
MKAIVLSLIVVLSPTAALSLDNQTQEILEKRTCQYLKSGWTLGETMGAIRSAVYQNERRIYLGTGSGSEIMYILRDEIVRNSTRRVMINALENRCPEFLLRN